MPLSRSFRVLFLLFAGASSLNGSAQSPGTPLPAKLGHSRHGVAFDEGFRERPWRMEGIGKVEFPITTFHAEVQGWFNQGIALLHSFWYEEAERSFRWCLKLDPGCAMAYWGLAMCSARGIFYSRSDSPAPQGRSATFLEGAVKRMSNCSQRERLYIRALKEATASPAADRYRREKVTRGRIFADELERVVLEFPADADARAFLGLAMMDTAGGFAAHLVLKDALRINPEHPGAHHYVIHNWDGRNEEQALDSCEKYGKAAPGIGHANHMPGHIYSGVGMWHEAAIWMDRATRVEKAYFRKRMKLPSETWNYSHNRDYLCYIQEQLGLAEKSIRGARELLRTAEQPTEPDAGNWNTATLARALVKFEKWEDVLKIEEQLWPKSLPLQHYARALAHLGLGHLDEAEKGLAELAKKPGGPRPTGEGEGFFPPNVMALELEGLLKIARGDFVAGIGKVHQAADAEQKQRDTDDYPNDPPIQPRNLYSVVGEAYLNQGSPKLAILAYEKALGNVRNDAFALSGLARAHHAIGEIEKASEYYGRLLHVWSGADPGLRWLDECRKLGLTARPKDASPRSQRAYQSQNLEPFGPELWEPYAAPILDATDTEGKPVRLEQFTGKNVLLIFYLGDECVHCLDQLREVKNNSLAFEAANTTVLAVSRQSPEQNKASEKAGKLGFSLLSDPSLDNAKRFGSYDEFEEIEIHSTVLIDARGRIIWKRNGGAPFSDMKFLLAQIAKANDAEPASLYSRLAAGVGGRRRALLLPQPLPQNEPF